MTAAELALGSAAAEILLFLGGCAALVAATFRAVPARLLWHSTVALLVLAALVVFQAWPEEASVTYGGLYSSSGLTAILQMGVLLASAGALAYSGEYLAERKILNGEFLSLALFATCGMMLIVAASHFLTLYLGLELMSLSLYAMIALRRDSGKAIESAMKYFVLGALASGLLLYGMSMVYAATGTLAIGEIASSIASGTVSDVDAVLAVGTVFVVAGVAFKLGAAPFHMWLPDVYDGAPTAVTLFIGAAPKVAAFAIAVRMVAESLGPLSSDWSAMLALLAVASLAVGNVAAIAQTSLKRMLAYSAISHMGFLLIGLVAATPEGYAAALFYALAYALMSVGGFGMLVLLSRGGSETETLDDMKGMARRNGAVAALMMVLMLSMAGVPPLVGFYAKFVVWSAAVNAGWTWLAVVAGVFSVIGAFYYLRVIKLMYFDEPEEGAQEIRLGTASLAIAGINGLLVLAVGIIPGWLLDACLKAIAGS